MSRTRAGRRSARRLPGSTNAPSLRPAQFRESADPARVFAITGHTVDRILTLCKLAWMRDNRPAVLAAADRVMMMADWIAYRLSGEAATDPSLASRTLYFDVRGRRWSEELLALAGLEPSILPPIASAGTRLAPVRADVLVETGLAGRPAVGVGGHDQIVGSFAAGLIAPGMVLDSIGTAEAISLITTAPLADLDLLKHGYFQTAVGTDRRLIYVGGGIDSSGGAIEWLRTVAGSPPQATLIAEAAAVPAGSGGVLFLPHLANGPPPEPDPDLRGAFAGLSVGTTRGALYRAVLEGLAFQARMMVDGMVGLPGVTAPSEIRVIGGSSRNPLFLAIKANVYGRSLVVIDEPEATALGAALLGGMAGGVYRDLDQALAGLERRQRVIEPDGDAALYEELRATVFERLHPALIGINHALAAVRSAHHG